MAQCKKANCSFANTGKCMEGLGTECPNLIKEEAKVDAPVELPPAKPDKVELYSGEPLLLDEARVLSRANETIVVAMVGLADSGKTSLIARLHQMFLSGPIAEYSFSGSRTLLRFEELNWKATLESGVDSPEMERSSRQFDNTFLHLQVRNDEVPDSEVTNVLINDVCGETVSEAIANEPTCKELVSLKRADHVVLVADGRALSEPMSHFDHTTKLKNFVERILQTKQLGSHSVLHVVFGKKDLLKSSDDTVHQVRELFEKQFSQLVGQMRFWEIAARPFDGSPPTCNEIGALFKSWILSSFQDQLTESKIGKTKKPNRDYCCFGRGG